MKLEIKGVFKPSAIWMAIISLLFMGMEKKAQSREFFDPAFINSSDNENSLTSNDLSIYETKNAQAPGSFRVDIILNGRYQDTRDISFFTNSTSQANENEEKLTPCLNLKLLTEYGVRIQAFPDLKENENGCTNFNTIPDMFSRFDFSSQKLNISIPQAALTTVAQDFISPEEFDDGINALFVNYQFSGADENKNNDENYSLNLQSGLNIGPWRVRNLGVWNKNKGKEDSWDSAYLYLQRSFRSINSNFVLGESSSLSDVFDSVPFTGAQLATDNSMLPESMRGYAPVIRGIAKTNARVIVKQNDYQVYQTFVAPGAFEITDIYPSGGSGDLYVTVEETDGTKQNFIVPFATLPVMVRENQLQYEITTGKYRPYDGNIQQTPFTQATITYGMTSKSTVYGGIQAASHYQALSTGLGYNLGEFGAASADVTQAWSKKQDEDKNSGQSWRLRFGKNILQTGTNITIAGYRYSTKGFSSLSEVLDTYTGDGNNSSGHSIRNRTNLTLNQSLGSSSLGSISISGLFEDYWDNNRTNKSFSVGYNGGWRGINYYLGYSYSRYTWDSNHSNKAARDDQRVSLVVTIPLSNWLPGSYASYQMTDSNPGSTDQYVTLGGTALENESLNWSIQQGYGNRDHYSNDVRGYYSGSKGKINAGYSYNKDSRRIDYGANGSILAHADGITFGQEISEASVLIKAPGLTDVTLVNDPTISTDFRGYAVLPYVTAYRRTDVALDNTSLGDNMELPNSLKQVVPTRGAIVRADYLGSIGHRAIIQLKTSAGKAVPYGAIVALQSGNESAPGIVSDAGIVYMSGLPQTGILNVQWGKSVNQQCQATFTLSNDEQIAAGVTQLNATCI